MSTEYSGETTIGIRIWQEHWECGDGCCSNSWWMGTIHKNGQTVFDSESDCYHSEQSVQLEIIHRLQKLFT